MSEIAQAVETGVKDVAEHAGSRFGTLVKEFYQETGQRMIKSAENVAETEAKNKAAIEGILKDGEQGLTQDARTAEHDMTRAAEGESGLPGESGPGQSSEGDGSAPTCADPVDVVSGQLVTWTQDVDLPGLLPLVLRRAYASGYKAAGLFGRGWSSTLDQRVEIDDDGIRYAGDDAQVLHYPVPTQPGQKVLPADGARWPLAWDRNTGTITIEDPRTGWTRHFAAPADPAPAGPASSRSLEVRPISAMSDRNGHRITYARDADGLPTAIGHSGGYRIAVETTYTAAGFRVEALRLPTGSDYSGTSTLVRYSYDPRGRLTGVVNSSGLPFIYEYDDADRMTAWIDRNGYRYEYAYDDAGRVVRSSGADGSLAATFEYDRAARITRSTNSLGGTAQFHYDADNHLVKTVDPAGGTALSEYDRYGRLLSFTDPLGRTLRYTYDEAGNPLVTEHPDGTRVTAQFNELGQPVRVTGPDGGTFLRNYDDRGNLLSVTDPLGARIVYEHDDAGRLTRVIDALGFAREIACDAAGLPLATTDALGGTLRYRRDLLGRVVEAIDPVGGETGFIWNIEGKLLAKIAPDGGREEFSYDAEGNLLEYRDAAGHTTSTEIDGLNLARARVEADGARYEFGYDSELRLTSVVNPLGLVWSYEYDAAGNTAAETDFDGRTLRYSHDAAGQLIAKSMPSGRVVEFEYDSRGHLVRQRAGDEVEQFEYNAAGLLVRATSAACELLLERDPMGRVVRESVNGRTMTHEYDAAGQRTRRTTPSGVVTEWAYDAIGAPKALVAANGSLAFEYDPAGRETARHLSDLASITRSWDAAHRLSGAAVWRRSQTDYVLVQNHGYAYRADGLPTTITSHLNGNRTFGLDAAGRVTTVDGAGWTERYAYDAAGSITSGTVDRAGGGEQLRESAGPREYAALRITRAGNTNYEYDEDGRLAASVRRTLSGQRRVWRYTWDGFDRLAGVTTPDGAVWRYRYDPLGRRIAKQRLGADGEVLSEVLFAWDDTRLAEQTDSTTQAGRTSASAARTVSWDYLPGTDEVAAQTVTRQHPTAPPDRETAVDQPEIDRRFYAIVTDLVGAPQELLTLGGEVVWQARHDLWGAPLPANAGQDDGEDCPLRFPGQYLDAETGLHYNLARYYDPAIGGYLTPDPLGLDPSSNHRAYVPNPLAWADPLGLAKCLQITDDTWDHIFKGGLNRGGRAYGYHYRPGGVDRYGVRTTLKSAVDEDGVYTGTVTQRVWDGNTWTEKSARSTFFPDDWSEEQVKHAVTRAAGEGSIVPDTNKWSGTYRGITIEGYFDPVTKHVITAYPLYKK